MSRFRLKNWQYGIFFSETMEITFSVFFLHLTFNAYILGVCNIYAIYETQIWGGLRYQDLKTIWHNWNTLRLFHKYSGFGESNTVKYHFSMWSSAFGTILLIRKTNMMIGGFKDRIYRFSTELFSQTFSGNFNEICYLFLKLLLVESTNTRLMRECNKSCCYCYAKGAG